MRADPILPAAERRFASGLLAAVAVVSALAGCAASFPGGSVAAGTPRADIAARWGQPSRVVPLPGGGERLQYSLQPFGRQTWMVDLDAQGRTVRSYQALTALNFQRIVANTWTRADIEREFGPPARFEGVSSWPGPVMTYQWKEGQDPMFYWVYLDAQDVVRRAHPGMEFVNAPNERN